jgi:hypothetical protein
MAQPETTPEKTIFDAEGNPVPKWKQIKMEREGRPVTRQGASKPIGSVPAGETKQFRNKSTGKIETFKKDGSGKWVKI